jgi:hypothetical protein
MQAAPINQYALKRIVSTLPADRHSPLAGSPGDPHEDILDTPGPDPASSAIPRSTSRPRASAGRSDW